MITKFKFNYDEFTVIRDCTNIASKRLKFQFNKSVDHLINDLLYSIMFVPVNNVMKKAVRRMIYFDDHTLIKLRS